jgi:hypothetical protein
MKAILFLTLATLLLISCSNEREDNLNKMKEIFSKYISDNTFRENVDLNVLEFRAISYETVSENTLDTVRWISILDRGNHFGELLKLEEDLLRKNMDMANLNHKLAGTGDVTDYEFATNRADIQKSMNDIQATKDSIQYYLEYAKNIENTIKNRKSPKAIYWAKLFLKATSTKNGEKTNIMDTIRPFFTLDIKLIKQ